MNRRIGSIRRLSSRKGDPRIGEEEGIELVNHTGDGVVTGEAVEVLRNLVSHYIYVSYGFRAVVGQVIFSLEIQIDDLSIVVAGCWVDFVHFRQIRPALGSTGSRLVEHGLIHFLRRERFGSVALPCRFEQLSGLIGDQRGGVLVLLGLEGGQHHRWSVGVVGRRRADEADQAVAGEHQSGLELLHQADGGSAEGTAVLASAVDPSESAVTHSRTPSRWCGAMCWTPGGRRGCLGPVRPGSFLCLADAKGSWLLPCRIPVRPSPSLRRRALRSAVPRGRSGATRLVCGCASAGEASPPVDSMDRCLSSPPAEVAGKSRYG